MAPSALYENGSLAAGRPGWLLINTFDLEARPKWAMESLAAHEAVPGHHLQYALVEELEALPAWRQWDVYPVFSEGWALYAETIGGRARALQGPLLEVRPAQRRDVAGHPAGGRHRPARLWAGPASRRSTTAAPTPPGPTREIDNEVDRYIAHPGGVTGLQDRRAQDPRAARATPKRSWERPSTSAPSTTASSAAGSCRSICCRRASRSGWRRSGRSPRLRPDAPRLRGGACRRHRLPHE